MSLGCGAATSGGSARAAPRLPSEAELTRLTQDAGGAVGVSIAHVESGAQVSLRGSERFPMASVFKLPLALTLLHRVEAGEFKLEDPVRITREDLAPGFSPMVETFPAEGVSMTMAEMIERVLEVGDNTVADVLLKQAGGPAVVTAKLEAMHLPGIDISRPERQLTLDYAGLPGWPEGEGKPNEVVSAAVKRLPPEHRRAAALRFLADPRDSASPDAMALLLRRLQRGELLGPAHTRRMLMSMASTRTGTRRLRGGLPLGTPLAHRTGTAESFEGVNAATNNVGIATMPDGSHLVMIVFIKGSTADEATREGTIASVARAAFEAYQKA